MKFLKKTAALLFCVALALSVMAISAMAAGDDITGYALSLANQKITRVSGAASYAPGSDPVDDGYYAVNKGDVISYDIMLANPSDRNSKAINSLEFTLRPVTGYTIEVTLGKDGGSTVTPTSNDVYAFNPSNTTDDITSADGTDATSVKVGTINIAVNDNASTNTQQAFSLTDISLSERDDTANAPIAPLTDAIKVIVDPEYVVSLDTKSVDGTTGVMTAETTFEVTNGVYKFTEGYTFPTASTFNGYTFNGWKVVAGTGTTATNTLAANHSGNGTWNSETYSNTATKLDTGKIGNVCLELQYTEVEYNVTYVYTVDDGTPTPTTKEYQTTYKISNVANGNTDYFGFLTAANHPTRNGYDFAGWTVAATAGSTKGDINSTTWTDAHLTPTSTASGLVGAYGEVTLTATWKIIGAFQFVDYAYAAGNDSLLLYAVPTAKLATGKYQCQSGDMIKIADATDTGTKQTNYDKYIAKFDSGKLEDETAYTLFAYFLNATTTPTPTFTIVTNATNDAVAYDGDVDQSNAKNAADYGNVNSLLLQTKDETQGKIQFGANYDNFNMRARLEADMSATGDTAMFGSIDDVVAIINTLGTART